MPGKVGAPTKFTQETRDKLILAIRKGAPYEIACDYAGINYSTFANWKNKAEDDQIPEFVEFFNQLKEVQGETALVWMDKIDKAMSDGAWQAAAWKLERRYYKYFSTNPVLLQDVQILGDKLDRLEKHLTGQKELTDGEGKRKELDTGSYQAPRCIAQGIEGTSGQENSTIKDDKGIA